MPLNTSGNSGVTSNLQVTKTENKKSNKSEKKEKIRDVVDIETYRELSRKWAIPILKDLFMGCKRFTDFLAKPRSNKDNHLSNRVLAEQLERLVYYGFVKKDEETGEYSLTKMGLDLNKMLYEKMMWAIKYGVIARDDIYFEGRDVEEVFGISKY